ncbi:MAG: 2,3-bisphosphoglycerate-independent phosphoglycerate mutase [bacterium]
MDKYKPLVLINIDGLGLPINNAPHLEAYLKEYPHTELKVAGIDMGLPEGQPGNSESGHLNLGAGRIIYTELARINKAIDDGSLAANQTLLDAFNRIKEKKTKLHLIGLFSDAGIHSHLNHLYALLELAKQSDLKKVYLHAIMDGRDTADPKSGMQYLESVEAKVKEMGIGRLATILGRYYAMDRNQQWQRVHQSYQALVMGKGLTFPTAASAMKYAYKHKETDEFITPTVLTTRTQEPVATIDDGDLVIFFNFRGDRCRELLTSLTVLEFTEFNRERIPQSEYLTLTDYEGITGIPSIFPKPELKNTLGEVLSENRLPQLRLAETERYAHVTYFFNGMQDNPGKKEDRVLIHSPKVDAYDKKPEMSAIPLTEVAVDKIKSGTYDFILITYANPVMVAHTGNLEAYQKAIAVVDDCVSQVVDATLAQHGLVLITSTRTSHISQLTSGSNAPFIIIGYQEQLKLRSSGILEDVAPTILKLIGITPPAEMTGTPLIF